MEHTAAPSYPGARLTWRHAPSLISCLLDTARQQRPLSAGHCACSPRADNNAIRPPSPPDHQQHSLGQIPARSHDKSADLSGRAQRHLVFSARRLVYPLATAINSRSPLPKHAEARFARLPSSKQSATMRAYARPEAAGGAR
ncbi:hypothetical protein CBOM_08054 [Ceraceosorus bombacis]|uniref:Uncharacterized protein n=1 Tax=Ceraceosorus bombacis TaxID=401625 RepID=A0A0P1BL92_9BASI|nr:hypothetical protein CBOM_08054 [Ceraceosorus bombacis]